MKTIFLLSILLLPIISIGQASIDGRVSAGDSIQIEISTVTPSEFPLIEVLFRAENLRKYPYWGLKKEDLKVFENELKCQVISLQHFSESEPINISIVIDHSGSMDASYADLLEYYDNDSDKVWGLFFTGDFPDIKSPLENAVTAVKGFLENFENVKDRIGLYSFDDSVDVRIKPTKDIPNLRSILDKLEPSGTTAFFDAVYLATESLIDLEGINVVIALTDGQDNASTKNSNDVISLAKENNIPIYCIGLGDALSDTLQLLADSTFGYYAYTRKSSALDSIYDLLNRKILAYYLMTYESPNWSSLDADRTLTIQFEQSDTYVLGNNHELKLPDEVINYLKEREEQEQLEFIYLVGGVAGGTILILGLTLFLLRRKRTKKLEIIKVYPNPGKGNLTIDIELGSNDTADLLVLDPRGTEVYKEPISSNDNLNIDLTHLARGNYSVLLVSDKEKSEVKKYMKL